MFKHPNARLRPHRLHPHEMLCGFGWAVLGGFLLTASKIWLKIRGINGIPLAALAFLWALERFALLWTKEFIFIIIGFRLTPFLWQARVDGKIH